MRPLIEAALEAWEGINDVSVTASPDGARYLITFLSPGLQNLNPLVVEDGVGHVERVNYTGDLDSMKVFGLGGSDRFGIDDVRIDMKIYGGSGEDFFQVGQLYKAKRNAAAGVPNADVFATIETTRGYLSNGISSPLTIFGGDDNDEFVVYHNLAPLQLFGDDGDDSFLIRAFALVGSQEDLRERTDVTGDAGADLIMYAVNAPVNIDGGDGFDTVIIIGTEFNDDFVVTENGVYGAGLNVLFTRVESVEVDGAEGDDRFFILGAGAEQINKITGGLGSDTFFINGATPPVVSNDLLGHSGLISHLVSSTGVLDSEYAGTKAVGIAANVADDDEPAIRLIETDGSSRVSQALGDWDSYGIVLTRKPENDALVVVRAYAPTGVRFKTVNGVAVGVDPDQKPEAVFLEFDETNWDQVQWIEFEADQQGSAVVQTATDGTNEVNNEKNEVQVLSIGATGGTFKLQLGGSTTAAIPFVTDGDGVKTAQQINAEAIEAAINASGLGISAIVSVTGSGTNYTITFTSPEHTDVAQLTVVENNLTANDFEGVIPGFITHDVSVQDGAIGNGDVIEDLFVFEQVPLNSRFLQIAGGLPTFIADQGEDALRGATIKVTAGSGIGQVRLIVGNSVTGEIEVNNGWLEGLDDTSRIEILRYSGVILPALPVEVVGDDGPALDARETEGSTFAAEAPEIHQNGAGLIDTVSLSLAQAPVTGSVTVALSSDEITPGGAQQLTFLDADDSYAPITSLTFTGGNWNTPRHIAIIGTQDTLVEGWHKPVFTMTASGAGTASVSTTRDGGSDHEVQVLSLNATGGSFTLTLGGSTTASIAYTGDTEELAQAIGDAINTSLGVTVSVAAAASGEKYFITFSDTADHDSLTVEGGSLTVTSRSSVVVDVADDEVPGVLVLQSDGSTDVIELGDGNFDGAGFTYGPVASAYDTYQVVLTKAPKAGETVTVNVIAEPTRTQRGAGFFGIRAFTQEVTVSDTDLVYDATDWYTAQSVTVGAVNDHRVDGGDSQSFATQLDLANNIEGPLEITGGMTDDRSADLEREPVMLLGETNFKPEIGGVVAADSYTITIDLDEVVDGVAETVTVLQGGSAGVARVVTNTDGRSAPPSPSSANEVQLLTIDAVQGWFRLQLPGYGTTADIEFNKDDPAGVALAIKTALNAGLGFTVADVVASGPDFLIKFATPANTDLPNLVPLAPTGPDHQALTKVGAFVDGWGGNDTDVTIVQNLAIYGNSGTFSLEVAGEPADHIPFDPTNENEKQAIQDAIQSAIDSAYPGEGVVVTVKGSGSLYQVTFDNPNGKTIADMVVTDDALQINEVQTLGIKAGNGTFRLKYQGDANQTAPLAWDISASALAAALEGLTGIGDVAVEVAVDPVRSERLYTITFLDPADANVDPLEVVDSALGRTVKQAIETKLGLSEALTAPKQLAAYTLEIVRNNAKNKTRIITGGTIDPGDASLFILEVDRAWEGGLTRDIPDADSLFTLEQTNPNLLVDENEETDILYLNDDDSVVSYHNDLDGTDVLLPAGALTITPERLTGLGMAPDPQYVGGQQVDGGVKYVGLEELYIDLGTGNNVVTVEDTHAGATTINAGRGEDVFYVQALSGHTFINAGPDADTIVVGNASLVDGVGALLTVTGDVPQVQVLTLAKGSPADPAFDVEAANEIQQFTVDAIGGTFKLGFTNPADLTDTEFTGALAWNAPASVVQSDLEALIHIAPGDVLVEKFGPIYRVSYLGNLAGKDIPLLSVNELGLTAQGPIDTLIVDDSAEPEDSLALLTSSSLTGLGMAGVNEIQTLRVDATGGHFRLNYVGGAAVETIAQGDTGQNEVQQLTIKAEGGTFTLGYKDGDALLSTNPIAFNPAALDTVASAIETELNGLTGSPITVSISHSGAVFTITFTDPGETDLPLLEVDASNLTDATPDLAYNITAAALQAALEDLGGVGAGNVRVDRDDDVYVIRFRGTLTNTDVAELVPVNVDLIRQVEYATGQFSDIVTTEAGDIQVMTRSEGLTAVAANEVQKLTLTNATSGTFTLAFGDPTNVTTGEFVLAYNLTAGQLQLSLESLAGIAAGDVKIKEVDTGDPTRREFTIEFIRELSSTDVPQLIVGNATDGTVAIQTLADGLDTAINDVQVLTVDAAGGTFVLRLQVPQPDGTTLDVQTVAIPYDASAEVVRKALQNALAFALTGANVIQVVSISSATTGSFQLAFNDDANATILLDPNVTASALQTALQDLVGLGGGTGEYTIAVTAKGNGNFEVEFLNTPFYLDVPVIRVINQNTDGSVIAYTQGLREAFKTDFTVAKVENTYILGFQGKTRQLDAGPGVSFLEVDTSGLTGTAEMVSRMDGVNYYGVETLDVLLGSGSDIVSVQGTGSGSYKYDMDLTAVMETSTNGDGANVPEVQRLTLNAAGTFTLSLGSLTTDPITVDPADTSGLAQAMEDAIHAKLGVTVAVTRDDEKFTITFVNPANPDVAQLVLDASNLVPVHAVTNISLGANAQTEHVFVSSDADLDRDTIFATDGRADLFDFLTGHLDDIRGDLNIDFGTGRHGLMISDEAATAGDGAVVITDTKSVLTDLNRLAADSEIWITGLAFGGMSYGVDPGGDLFEGIGYWTGSGDDTVAIDGTHNRAGERTTTMLNTGMGNDHLTVDLDTGEDGFFVLNTMGGSKSVDPGAGFGISEGTVSGDDDYVDATASSLPLTVFGGIGQDEINSGSGADLIFGDFGRVWYFDAVSGAIVAVHGFGGRGDIMDSRIVDAKLMFTIDRTLGDNDIIRGGDGEDVIVGGAGGDRLDGDEAHDLIFGDNVSLDRRGDFYLDYTDPRYRTLDGPAIYNSADETMENSTHRLIPALTGTPRWQDWEITLMDHSFAVEADPHNKYGDDYIAGGENNDKIFGQLGDDIIQGDGSIDLVDEQDAAYDAGAWRNGDGTLTVQPSFETTADGDDYIEGNGGDDVIFGGLGQDDIVGGNSELFSLTDRLYRPDGGDMIFGGAGTDIARNFIGDATVADGTTPAGIPVDTIIPVPTGHARDADVILGDNGNVYRLVEVIGVSGDPRLDATQYLEFNYDKSSTYEDRGTLRLIPRGAELLDYTPGGADFNAALAALDIGAADEVHGESGDDFLYGMVGSDILFGDGQDDDLIGGYGNDWISGGTGQDGAIGDDGRIYTSRNGTAEPLNGVAEATDEDSISTPGSIQQADINVTGEIKKAVNLTPFSQDPDWMAQDDEWAGQSQYTSDDIIYGGLGSDFLHGGSGDDAISGAEALPAFYDVPANLGNALGYDPVTGEFAAYDEFDPLRLIAGLFLNFNEDEGVLRPDGTVSKATGHQADTYGEVHDDGADRIFGDLGNDWLVGGTGRDDLYGGWGDDLLNADDDLTTNGGLNDQPDTHPSYEDRAYGGAGRDVLIGNTGGDRLIDWVGEFNSYIVPFAPYGEGTVTRMLQPQLPEFLYALSASDGVDLTRAVDTGADPVRSGEPFGELGLVKQQDFAWQDQTGAPADPQAGNIPGGSRDVLRSASFDSAATPTGFFADSGVWQVSGGVLQVAAASKGSDAVSVFFIEDALPGYFEVQASISVVKPTGGWKANSYLIFDYQGKQDFKFAGLDVALNKLVMGHRDAAGWQVDEQAAVPAGVKAGQYYNLLVAINGVNATLQLNNKNVFSHTYQPRVVDGYSYGLNAGMIGVGSDNARGTFDNIRVQVLPPQVTFDYTEDFSDGVADLFTGDSSGTWSVNAGIYSGSPDGSTGMSLLDLGPDNLNVSSYLELTSKVRTTGRAGFVFDRYGDVSFKFAAIDAATDQVIIGHYTAKNGWVNDAVVSKTIDAGICYTLGLTLKGATVSVTLDGQTLLGHSFNAATVDGNFGLLVAGGTASFDDVRVGTDDPAFRTLLASVPPEAALAGGGSTLTTENLDAIGTAAIARLNNAYALTSDQQAQLRRTEIRIADLGGLTLGETVGTVVFIDRDAAGYGWFIDSTPLDDVEFSRGSREGVLTAAAGSEAAGDMDLLTVLMHEFGHVLGLVDLSSGMDAADLMFQALSAGLRRTETRLLAGTGVTCQPGVWPCTDRSRGDRSVFENWLEDRSGGFSLIRSFRSSR